jgi:hypothetical protein
MKSLGVGYREEAMSDVTGNLNWMTILIRNRMSTTLKNLDCNNFGILLAFSISASVCVCVCVWWKGLTRGSCHCQSNFSRPCMWSRQETSEPGDVILPEFKDGREGNVCNRIRSRPALSSSSSFLILAAPVFFIPLENPSGLLLHFVLLLFGGGGC